MTDEEFTAAVDAATKRVASMDEHDGHQACDPLTIMLALEAGLKRPDNGAQFDAYVMLRQAVAGMKKRIENN